MYDYIRISDADRDRVTDRLREHFAEGRLTADELDERLTATLSAKTYGDLRAIMADLPEPETMWQHAAAAPQPGLVPPGWNARPVQVRRGPRLLPVVLMIIAFALILPGPGLFLFGIAKLMLLVWLVLGIGGVFAAGKSRRGGRHYTGAGNRDWRGPRR